MTFNIVKLSTYTPTYETDQYTIELRYDLVTSSASLICIDKESTLISIFKPDAKITKTLPRALVREQNNCMDILLLSYESKLDVNVEFKNEFRYSVMTAFMFTYFQLHPDSYRDCKNKIANTVCKCMQVTGSWDLYHLENDNRLVLFPDGLSGDTKLEINEDFINEHFGD